MGMKGLRGRVKMLLSITLALSGLAIDHYLLPAQSRTQPSSQLPAPPDTGTPEGNSTSGGTRLESTCKETKKPLTALVANNGKDFTLSKYPTFWFYVPYTPEEIGYLEFAIKNPQQFKTVYRTAIELKDTPGIIKVTIPPSEKHSLKLGQDYTWDLIFYCKSNRTDEPDRVLNGWIRRVPINSQIKSQLNTIRSQNYRAYIENDIWSDAIAAAAELYFANPGDRETKALWTDILQLLGYKGLDREVLTQSVLLPPQ